ncbi:hypothetical protein NHQ30_009063 [Ciborinia camelliae]|nr:hypothetical protein NHQ30_009063 [Ciborinia camelliae]
MNFGVLEVALSTGKSAPAPGWAYVPDITNATPQIGLQASSRRARGPATPGGSNAHETTKKQDAKVLRELLQLDRENHRDVSIPVLGRGKDGSGRVTQGKVTPAVRKILASQKTFANHLSDYEALASLPSSTSISTSQQPASPAIPSPQVSTPGLTSTGKRSHKRKEPLPPGVEPPKRSHKKKDPNAPAISTPLRNSVTPALKVEASGPPLPTEIFASSTHHHRDRRDPILHTLPLTHPHHAPRTQTAPPRPRSSAPLARPRAPHAGRNREIVGPAGAELSRGARRSHARGSEETREAVL